MTGSNRGIGLELIKQFLSKSQPPEKLFATCRDPDGPRAEELKQLVSKHKNLVLLQLDSTNPDSIKKAVKSVEEHLKGTGLNLLLNNAGIMSSSNLGSIDSEDMINIFNTNVVGPLLVTQAFYHLLKKSADDHAQEPLSCKKAALVNMSSLLGSLERTSITFDSSKQVISYRVSKAALNMLTKCQAESYKRDGVLCTAVHPGWVKTDMGTERALLTTEESINGILNVLEDLSEKESGTLVAWDGNVIPW